MAIDRTFGSSGAIWSAAPLDRIDFSALEHEVHYTGGTSVGLDVRPGGPTLVIAGWTPEPVSVSWEGARAEVVAAHIPSDGHPEEEGRFAGTEVVEISPSDSWATPLAVCDSPTGGTAVLMRAVSRDHSGTVWNPPSFMVRVIERGGHGAGGFVKATVPIPASDLFDPVQDPVKGNARLAVIGGNFVILSTYADRVKVTVVPLTGATTDAPPVQLGGPGSALPGLTRLDIASVRVDGSWLSLALTAYLNHPGLGPASVGALLRIAADGTRDSSFGESGLWVSPLTNVMSQFVCAGGFPGGIAGIQGSEVIAFGIEPGASGFAAGGSGLDETFGVDGIFRKSLGGGLSTPVAVADGSWSYVFARRQDGRAVGCRFNRQGVADSSFGNAGLSVLPADESIISVNDITLSNGHVALALTRDIRGVDCDRVPSMVMLDTATSRPDTAFGAGGFALHGAVGEPAVVCPDGSSYYSERMTADGARMNLRRADPAGRFERVIAVTAPGIASPTISSLWALDDGSLLIGGYGNPAWISKLTPAGTPDSSFGTNGLAIPLPGIEDNIRILGVRADGRIAMWLDIQPPGSVALLNADGSLDTSYGQSEPTHVTPGVVSVFAFSHLGPQFPDARPFLDADGSILCLVSSVKRNTGGASAQGALRRITPSGTYDAAFGLGLPGLHPEYGMNNPMGPDSDEFIRFHAPTGGEENGHDSFHFVDPVGFGWIDGSLYVIACGVSGVPSTPGDSVVLNFVLVVSRWDAHGKKDQAFGNQGWQDAGFDPDRINFRPRGVMSALVEGTEHAWATPPPPQLIVYGEAGWAETVTTIAADETIIDRRLRRAEPAIFRVSHPHGIDRTFGNHHQGADLLPMQEFEATTIAARVLPPTNAGASQRVRIVCSDIRMHPNSTKLKSNFGGIGQFTLTPEPALTVESLMSRLRQWLHRRFSR